MGDRGGWGMSDERMYLTDQNGERHEAKPQPDGSYSLLIPEGVTSLTSGDGPPARDGVVYEVTVGKSIAHPGSA
jgi:hypothetical protein